MEEQTLQINDWRKKEREAAGAVGAEGAAAAEPPPMFIHTRHSGDGGWGLGLTFSPVPPVLCAPITEQTY